MKQWKKLLSFALSLIMSFGAVGLNAGLLSSSAAEIHNGSAELPYETVYALVGTGEAEPFEVSVTDAAYPSGELSLGGAYGIGGVLHSSSIIEKVFGGIYTLDGEKVIYYEFEPHADNFSIYLNFDPVLTFNILALGDYLYKIEASNAEGDTVTAVESTFSVVDNSKLPSEIAVSEASLPADVLPENCVFSVRGQVSSTYLITNIWGGVYHADGTATQVYYADTPNKVSYNLYNTFDNYLAFGDLSAGDYVYKIEAEDIRGTVVTLIEKSFRITADEAPSDIQAYNATYPTGAVAYGGFFSAKGSVFSTHILQNISGGIYKAEGSDSGYDNRYAFSINNGDDRLNNRKSFNIAVLDYDIEFNKLPIGEYVYKVTATDVKGYTKELVNSPFVIRDVMKGEDEPVVMKGIDVSAHQGEIDWEQVKADGIEFAILRAGVTNNADATYYEDRWFERYYSGAKEAGLKIGAYLYTSAFNQSEIRSNVEDLLDTLDGRALDLPVYIDIETDSRQPQLGKKALTEMIACGCELIAQSGYQPGVYSSYTWYRDYIDADLLSASGVEIWLALWPNNPDEYDMSDFCVTWQFCSDGQVTGISGDVDMDYRYIKAELFKLGDVDMNGEVEITDATMIQRYDARLLSFTEPEMRLADVDRDDDVCIIDCTWIQRYLAGVKAPEGIGEPIKL